METLWHDLRQGWRMLARNPGFTAVAVLSLALGIGANTTIFSFVNGLLFRPPGVQDPARLLEVWQHNTTRGNSLGSHSQLSYPDILYFRDHNQVFSSMAFLTGESTAVIWNRNGEGETVQSALVSANFFSVAGIQPALGRGFLPQDDQPSSTSRAAVLSHSFWRLRLGSDPAIVGKTLNLDGQDFTVVGVAPARFTGIFIGSSPELWLPLATHFTISPSLNLQERHMHWLLGIGRLKPGVTPAQAKSDFAILSHELSRTFPNTNRESEAAVVPVELVPAPFRGLFGGITGGLMIVVALVLFIACGNAANLLLAVASGRQREMAVRAALGASRPRLIRQTLAESVLIALLAGALGLASAFWAAPLLLSLKPSSLPLAINVSLDTRVLAFTLIASILTGLVFGLVPALHGSKLDLVHSLKDSAFQGGAARSRFRSFLVVAQVAACMVLLAASTLCLRSLLNARSIDPGFDPHNAVAAALDLTPFGYSETLGKLFDRDLLDRVRSLPGVHNAAFASHLPLGHVSRMEPVGIEGEASLPAKSGDPALVVDDASVGPGYFETMGIPLLHGRTFSDQDIESAPAVIVINQIMADRFWKSQDPVGKFVRLFGPQNSQISAQVVGIVKPGKYQMLGEDPKPYFYRCRLQDYDTSATLVIRTQGDSVPVLTAVRREVHQLDSRITLVGVETLDQHMQLPLFPAQAAGLLLGVFGVLALMLAVVGLYSVVAYSTTQRTHELAIRSALGAARPQVLKLVLWQGLKFTLMGVSIGIIVALAAARLMTSLLYGVSPNDPLSFVAVAVLLAIVALLASYVPARRAMRVDPLVALKYE